MLPSISIFTFSDRWSSVRPAPVCVLILAVRGVDCSCAKHLTIEFYTIIMLLRFISIPSPPTLSFQA